MTCFEHAGPITANLPVTPHQACTLLGTTDANHTTVIKGEYSRAAACLAVIS